jgi:hypothetical protein
MGFFDWLRGKRRPAAQAPPADPVLPDDVAAAAKPGQGALVFSDLESLMRLAESMEAAERQGPKRPLLYMFQHVALREAAFENHPELIRELAGEPSPLPLLHSRSRARLRCLQAGFLDVDHMDDDAEMEAEEELFSAVKVHPHRRGGHTAYVVTMPVPEASPEAHFVAIVHRDAEPHDYMQESPSTRYFTLEKTDGSDRPLLCEWRRDGSHMNYGEGPAPELGAFLDAVFDRVSAGVR